MGFLLAAIASSRRRNPAPPATLPLTAYTQAYGSGARNQWIDVAFSGGLGWVGSVDDLVNGNTSSNLTFFTGSAVSGETITFGPFPREVLITGIKYYQQLSSAQGTWQCQISDDGSSWTSVGSSFALGGTTTQTITEMAANTTGCLYLRLLGVSGSTSALPYVYQFEFECGVFGDLSDLAFPGGRFQTHIAGDNTPLFMYQDAACTTPATTDYDPIWVIVDELGTSGLRAVQADSNKQGYLLMVGGVPTVQFDAVDDFYETGSGTWGPDISLCSGFIYNSAAKAAGGMIGKRISGWQLYQRSANIGAYHGGTDDNTSWGGLSAGTPATVWLQLDNGGASEIRVDGVQRATFTATAFGSPTTLLLGSDGAGNFYEGALISSLCQTALTGTTERATIEAYVTSLNT